MKPYRIIGIESSPYAVKVRAVARYRRIPQSFDETKGVRPLLMPVVQFPDGEYFTDSTPIIRRWESLHPDGRSVLPSDPADAFLCSLIEDMADEWLTKCLFYYRFATDRDGYAAASWVMDDSHRGVDTATLGNKASAFVQRQVERMALVGATVDRAPLLEQFYLGCLRALEAEVATDRFLFGTRPSLADFGLFGQLRTLSFDLTPGGIMRERAPRTWHWMGRLDDCSGVEGYWNEDASVTSAVTALCTLAGQFYLPFLSANAHAIENGLDTVEVLLDGHAYSQPPFRYQAKCWRMLVDEFSKLDTTHRARVEAVLAPGDGVRHLDTSAAN